MPQKLQILAIFGDPRNFIASKIPCFTISCSSLKKGKGILYVDKIMACRGVGSSI